MRVLSKKNSKVSHDYELKAMTLIENIVNGKLDAASLNVKEMVTHNINKRAKKISKTEPLI